MIGRDNQKTSMRNNNNKTRKFPACTLPEIAKPLKFQEDKEANEEWFVVVAVVVDDIEEFDDRVEEIDRSRRLWR